ncbi:hypothetical protein CBS101457_002278 [Exobasidium rhododendri]|nr:hypothetical protein CBS101457_002278 [Exobasidium rhododendri]
MIGHSVVELQGVRCFLRQPLRPRLAFSPGSLLPHATKPLPSTCRGLRFGKNLNRKITDYQRGKTSERSRVDDIVSDLPDFSLPAPPDRLEVLRALRHKVEKITGSILVQGKISGWGVSGQVLKHLLDELDPAGLVPEGRSPRRTIGGLMEAWAKEATMALGPDETTLSSYWDLDNVMHAYEAEGERSLERMCVNSFLRWLTQKLEGREGSKEVLTHLRVIGSIGDLRHPPLKFSTARALTRQIHLHVGPTNSGKTHGALLALCKANTGLYAGPLRLLAHEVWDRINSGTVSPGIPPRACNLKTGEEIKISDELAGLEACTVEMVNFTNLVDVAVIDEIQMIGDAQRGQAWTNAVLGIPAKEMHLCGEASVIPLIKRIAEACGDKVHIHEYKRLTPLAIGAPLNGDLKKIQKGDCLVAFSRSEIFRLKKAIEEKTDFKCALAYGALPPETKAEQAKLFNDPENEVSVMVASDAIGMGLNLKIKRIIFSKVQKWNGTDMVPISASQIKQIAGRAGRFGTKTDQEEQGGLVTTMDQVDLPVLESALEAPLLPITRAVIQPSSKDLASLATALPMKRPVGHQSFGRHRSMISLLQDLQLITQIDSSTFLLSPMEQQNALAPLLEDAVPTSLNLTIAERELFALAPANVRDERLLSLFANMVGYYVRSDLVKFEKCDISLGMMNALRSIEKIQERVTPHLYPDAKGPREPVSLVEALGEVKTPPDINSLMLLESLHRGLTLYLWFSFRLPLAFCYRDEVERHKLRAESAIAFSLEAIKAGRIERMAARANDGEGSRLGYRKGVRQSNHSSRGSTHDHRNEARPTSRGGGSNTNGPRRVDRFAKDTSEDVGYEGEEEGKEGEQKGDGGYPKHKPWEMSRRKRDDQTMPVWRS